MAMKVDLDKATQRAWKMLETDLSRRIRELEPDGSIRLEVEGPERGESPATPYVEVYWCVEDGLVAGTPRNFELAERFRLAKPARRELAALGWRKRSTCRQVVVEDPAATAEVLVATLRQVWAVPHPSFLVDADDLVPVEPDEADQDPTLRKVGPRPMRLRGAVESDDIDELRELVDRTMSEHIGEPVTYDSDDDAWLASGSSVLFVRVTSATRIRLFAEMVLDLGDLRMARHEVAVLNRDLPHFKFVLLGDRIKMAYDLLASPFAPTHLTTLLDCALLHLDRLATDVAYRVRGRCFLSLADDSEEVEGEW